MSHQYPKSTYEQLCLQISQVGLKVTQSRIAMLNWAKSTKQPFTAEQLIQSLTGFQTCPHKATIYRDLADFVRTEILNEFIIKGVSAHYYEINTYEHIHHFICERCLHISIIKPDHIETAIANYQQQLTNLGIQVTSHSLKFYGLCPECVKE